MTEAVCRRLVPIATKSPKPRARVLPSADGLHDLLHLGPLRSIRCKLQESLETSRHQIGTIRAVMRQAGVVLRMGKRRLQRRRAIECGGGASPILTLEQHDSERITRLGQVRVSRNRLVRRVQRSFIVTSQQLLRGLTDEVPCVVCRTLDELVEEGIGSVRGVELLGAECAKEQYGRVRTRTRGIDNLLIEIDGRGEVTAVKQRTVAAARSLAQA